MRNDDKRQAFAAISMASNIGLTMVATVAVGLVLGRMADRWLDSEPWCTAGGILLGMITGMWSAYKKAMSNNIK